MIEKDSSCKVFIFSLMNVISKASECWLSLHLHGTFNSIFISELHGNTANDLTSIMDGGGSEIAPWMVLLASYFPLSSSYLVGEIQMLIFLHKDYRKTKRRLLELLGYCTIFFVKLLLFMVFLFFFLTQNINFTSVPGLIRFPDAYSY